MPTGFDYPATVHVRRHGPRGYSDYHSYRPWLRDEFCFRCVYCLFREQWGRISGEFGLDHFVAQAINPLQISSYENLFYACTSCNIGKGAQPIPEPTGALTAEQVVVNDDGSIIGLTEAAIRIIRLLDLNDEDYRRWRQTWIRILDLAKQFDPQLHRQLMGFPDDLPDLSRSRPPAGNLRPEGIAQSYFELRKRGELSSTY